MVRVIYYLSMTIILLSCGDGGEKNRQSHLLSTRESAVKDVSCFIDGISVNFVMETLPTSTPLIKAATATLDSDVQLKYYFNPYYGAGGKLSFIKDGSSKVLLRWKAEFENSVLESTNKIGESTLYCAVIVVS